MSWQNKLQEWHDKQLITSETMRSIEQYEAQQPSSISQLWRYSLIGLAVLCIGMGLLFIVASNWQNIPFSVRLASHTIFNLGLGSYILWLVRKGNYSKWQLETPLIILAAVQLSLMALIGQYLQISSPIEDVLLFWWILIAPMLLLLGQSVFSGMLFFGLGFFVLLERLNIQIDQLYMPFFWLSTAAYFAGITSWLRQHRLSWAQLLQQVGFYTMIILTTWLLIDIQIYASPYNLGAEFFQYNMLATALLTAVTALAYIRQSKSLTNNSRTHGNEVMILSFATLVVSYLTPSSEFMDAFLFCLYFLGIGWISYRYYRSAFLVISIIAVSIRMIIYFCELLDNLLLNGLMMIVVGLAALFVLKKLVLQKRA